MLRLHLASQERMVGVLKVAHKYQLASVEAQAMDVLQGALCAQEGVGQLMGTGGGTGNNDQPKSSQPLCLRLLQVASEVGSPRLAQACLAEMAKKVAQVGSPG